jgi:hypothetical protein
MDPKQLQQLQQYLPWIKIIGVFVLFFLLRFTRQGLRRRVIEIGYRTMRERGLTLWFWLNAPGVMIHELSHALVILLFYPFGFRITGVTLFQIKPQPAPRQSRRAVQQTVPQGVQLGEVRYTRPPGHFMSHVGDGFSGIAPLIGGIAMFLFLYWVATGYTLWGNVGQQFHFLRPGWPWWTLLFAPYLILTVTSELWPSRVDWHGARWLVIGLLILALAAIFVLWVGKVLIFDDALLLSLSSIATYIDFAFLVLLALDAIFFILAEGLVQSLRR